MLALPRLAVVYSASVFPVRCLYKDIAYDHGTEKQERVVIALCVCVCVCVCVLDKYLQSLKPDILKFLSLSLSLSLFNPLPPAMYHVSADYTSLL